MAFTVTQKKRARRLSKAFLKELGCPANLKGFPVLSECIAQVAEFPERINPLKLLLENVYKDMHMGYNYPTAFQNISACICTVFRRCSQEKLAEHFGCVISPEKGSLSCAEFIATSALEIHDKTLRMREL